MAAGQASIEGCSLGIADTIRELFRKWNDWSGDKEMERAIRRQLDRQGYASRTARLRNFRLIAIQRPGWVQIYSFSAVTKTPRDQSEVSLLGLCKDDGRSRAEVAFFLNEEERQAKLLEWSEGMILRN